MPTTSVNILRRSFPRGIRPSPGNNDDHMAQRRRCMKVNAACTSVHLRRRPLFWENYCPRIERHRRHNAFHNLDIHRNRTSIRYEDSASLNSQILFRFVAIRQLMPMQYSFGFLVCHAEQFLQEPDRPVESFQDIQRVQLKSKTIWRSTGRVECRTLPH